MGHSREDFLRTEEGNCGMFESTLKGGEEREVDYMM